MNMHPARNIRQQSGFTLIELIVVIVILGILAATALPKFADMGGDARFAALKGAKGALEATVAMAHGKALVSGQASTAVSMDGVSVPMAFSYPTASVATAQAAGLTSTEWSVAVAGSVVTIKPLNLDAAKTSCFATYTAPAAAGEHGTVAITASATDC